MAKFRIGFTFILAALVFLCSCNSDDPLVEGTFFKDSIEKGNSLFFVRDSDGSRRSITAEGTFAEFEEVLFQEFSFESLNFLLEEVTLISAHDVQIKINIPGQGVIDTTVSYIDIKDPFLGFSIVLDAELDITLEGRLSNDENSVSFAYKSYACSFQSGSYIDYSPLITEHMGIFEDLTSVTDTLISQFRLMPQDTIALNISNVVMRKN